MNVDQICLVTLAVIALALALMGRNYSSIKKKKSHKFGEDDLKKIPTEYRKDASYFGRDVQDGMLDLSRTIRSGAKTFMLTEYKTIIIVVLILAVVFSFLIEASSGLTFLLGALMSSLACIIGMVGAVYANYRVARRAFKSFSVGRTVKTALKGGSISGLSVESFGLLGLIIVVLFFGIDFVPQDGHGLIVELINSFRGHNSFVGLSCNPTTMRLTTYSLGCSLVAMFNRVAGGNFTKAADISADIVAKVRHDMPEDDARMPNTIADFIGDNVNDIAGNCSDLLESFVATIVASLLISNLVFKGSGASVSMLNATITFPLALAAIGLLSCIIGLIYSLFRKNNGGNDPSKALDMTTYISAAVTIIGSAFAAKFIFDGIDLYGSFHAKWASPWVASIFGIASGVLVGKITEYYTDTKYTPVKSLAAISPEGEAFVATKASPQFPLKARLLLQQKATPSALVLPCRTSW